MNDHQIRSELERRAGSAPTQPDWTKRTLLPAVWREVDARPQPVMTSRWPSFAGAAALVGALLVLVVAVPRLGPEMPSSTDSPSGTPPAEPTSAPGILTTSEFAARLAAGDLAGRTVLVDGSIAISARRGQACVPYDPPHHCFLGTLEGAEPTIDIWTRTFPTTESESGATWAGPGIWPWWTGPDAVSGILVLSVAENGQVDFIGPARPSPAGLGWSLDEVTTLDPATLNPDEVLVVRGRLYSPVPPGTVYDRTCPGWRPFDGLPSRFCGNFDTLSTATPGGDQIQIQAGAAEAFGTEHEALYAIAPRLYGSCVGAPPCWLWDVVARIAEEPEWTPTPEPTTPTPSPITEGTQTHACRWDADESTVTAIDHSGLIVDCSVRLAPLHPIPVPVVSSDESGHLVVEWQVNADCPADESIEFWGPIEDRPQLADYMLRVARTTTGGTECDDPNASRLVYLTLSGTVDHESVRAFLAMDGGGLDIGREWGGMPVVRLEIAPSKPEYAEGEAIDVTSSLWPETDVTVTCLFSYGISVEQLDGGISFYPGPVASACPGPRVLRPDEPVTADFVPVWGIGEPNPLAPWLRDDELYLPFGTYLFTIRWTYSFPDDAPESYPRGPVELEASVVVTVR